ncbi:MAG: leucyl/phenylalanyl-tRNA--protein transferase [Myxococcales bacterium]|nr:leucyl/phenylalanyl-tRNA--protein transferase [Myxococcales bacterium]
MPGATRALVRELVRAYPFPDPSESDPRGLLAWGGDLEPERLLSAYAQGIFPWYDEPPILWFSPDPRMVLLPAELHVGRSLAKRARARPFALTMDTAFERVIRACREAPRPGQSGTWITNDMVEAYCRLHALGFAHSVEAWSEPGGDLVGGVYGLSLGRAFFGESMFARAADASKLAFVALVRQLEAWDFTLVDCQVRTEHLARFGARSWSREVFLAALARALDAETRRGRWAFEAHEPIRPDAS